VSLPSTCTCWILVGLKGDGWFGLRGREVDGWKRDKVCAVICRLCGCERGGVGAGEGDEILIANESAGFGADDEEDVGTGPETGGGKLVADDGFSTGSRAEAAATLASVVRGDDGREKTKVEPSNTLLGVDCAAIVLVGVGGELVRVVGHGMIVSSVTRRVFMLLAVSELEFLRRNSLMSSGAWMSSSLTHESCAGE
jgi:hypothetical protein